MDGEHYFPKRVEMADALTSFAGRAGVVARYGCRWESTRREDDEYVLVTSDGEYRCRAVVFAIGVTEPWTAPIPGLDDAPHYTDTRTPEQYDGKSVFIVGKRNSAFELAQGLLPWARQIVMASPRPVQTEVLAFSPLSIRYLSPYMQHIRGGSGSFVVDAAIAQVERHADGYRIRASGTTWEGAIDLEADEVIAATGFRAPVRDLPALGVAMVNDGRMPAQTPYWESVSVPGIYFAGNVMGASAGLRKHGATSSAASVNGYRYNVRVLAQHIAETHFGIARAWRQLSRDEAVAFLLGELARAPELWIQKGYLARVVETDGGYRDGGIVPLADHVDRDGGDSVAVTVEYAADGAVTPVVYVRRGGRLSEHALPTDPLHRFDTDEHRRQLDALVA
jgi:thioredoxin reductase